jgi:putative tricarboxylic transport membrane protein
MAHAFRAPSTTARQVEDVAGYLLKTRGFEPAPLLLAFVLSPPLRDNLNRALVFANGNVMTFVTHPVSAVLLAIAGAALMMTALPAVRRGRALAGRLS